jgi:hypothetical protein
MKMNKKAADVVLPAKKSLNLGVLAKFNPVRGACLVNTPDINVLFT